MKGTKGQVAIPQRGFKALIKAFLLWLLFPLVEIHERLGLLIVLRANHKGSEGVVHVGTTAIAELRSYEYSHTNEPIDDTVLSDTDRTFQSGVNSWAGSASAFWDESDTNGQEALDIGSAVTLKFYPEGASQSDTFHQGTAIVEGITRRAAINGMVEVDFTFRGSGALAQTTVS